MHQLMGVPMGLEEIGGMQSFEVEAVALQALALVALVHGVHVSSCVDAHEIVPLAQQMVLLSAP
jgi:hypothetical protein